MLQETENKLNLYYGKHAFKDKEQKKNMYVKRWTDEEKKLMGEHSDDHISALVKLFPDRSEKSIEQYRYKMLHPVSKKAKKKRVGAKEASELIIPDSVKFPDNVAGNIFPTVSEINKLLIALPKEYRVSALSFLVDLHMSV